VVLAQEAHCRLAKALKPRHELPICRGDAMNSTTSIARSGMEAALLHLGAAANNIANARTPDYRRQFVQQESLAAGGVTTSMGRAAEPGENLAEDLVEQKLASYSFKANLRVIQTQDEMLGTVLDAHA
jgi:flagellar hook-associated protein FlgK